MKTKKSIGAFILAAVLLLSMVGMASAASQGWYLKDSGGATGADYEMQRTSGHGSAYVEMTDESKIWSANEPTAEGVSFGTGTWTGLIDYIDPGEGGFLDEGETMKVEIGSLSSPGGAFTPAMEMTENGPSPGTSISVAPGSEFIVPKDHYLALRLTVSGTVSGTVRVEVNGGPPGASYIQSPEVDPGYPYPELSTLVLLSFGLLVLTGYVGYKRRNNKLQ